MKHSRGKSTNQSLLSQNGSIALGMLADEARDRDVTRLSTVRRLLDRSGGRGRVYMTAEETCLLGDVNAQTPGAEAAALRLVRQSYYDEIEREQRLPQALIEQFRAAGFCHMVIPGAVGGQQVDPLTYLRVIKLLAEYAG